MNADSAPIRPTPVSPFLPGMIVEWSFTGDASWCRHPSQNPGQFSPNWKFF